MKSCQKRKRRQILSGYNRFLITGDGITLTIESNPGLHLEIIQSMICVKDNIHGIYVSARTIYRDIKALEQTGVPILTEEGNT